MREEIDVLLLDGEHRDVVVHCRALRERGFRGALIVCAQVGDRQIEVMTLDAGADDYWIWSEPLCLLARIRACLRRSGDLTRDQAHSPALLGKIRLEGDDASVDGEPCLLTRRELSLLQLLARRSGQVVTRGEILAHWGLRAALQGGNFIDVHVMRLRRKLGAAGGQLETVRGQGLCLRDVALTPSPSEHAGQQVPDAWSATGSSAHA